MWYGSTPHSPILPHAPSAPVRLLWHVCRGDAPFCGLASGTWSAPASRHWYVVQLPGPGRGAPSVLGAPPNMCHLLFVSGWSYCGGRACVFLPPQQCSARCGALQWVLVVIATATDRGVLLAPAHCWACCKRLLQFICRQLHFTRLHMFTRFHWHLSLTAS